MHPGFFRVNPGYFRVNQFPFVGNDSYIRNDLKKVYCIVFLPHCISLTFIWLLSNGMSHPIVPQIDTLLEINHETNDPTSSATLNPVLIDKNQLKNIQFAEKEKQRRSLDNKRYREKKRILLNLSVAERNKKIQKSMDEIATPYDKLGCNVLTELSEEINRILTFSTAERIKESKRCFRWISTVEDDDKYILQYKVGDGVYVDFLFIAKSTIENAGYGLFAAMNLPKGLPITIYLGRVVKDNKKKRSYMIQQNYKFVKGKANNNRWEKVRKGRSPTIIDGLTHDSFQKWTNKREFFLGAHMLNDLNFKNKGDIIPCNCVVQPMLEVVTNHAIDKDSELFINYNR